MTSVSERTTVGIAGFGQDARRGAGKGGAGTYHSGSAGLAVDGLQAHVLHPQLHLAMPFALQVNMMNILSFSRDHALCR